ncbi:hypothetical protein [Nocardioides aurantiacus]|uniref:Uncharacterized protein n=1 Tax=Nocardioides aurantiacus TaxID=86796 RepID=A0A3N2CWM3_9ACTN|nr:hypothetical protein [Nocardioides aurantiacus]ROR91594.1 hypothetical protein EDD33_2464 [Nocardioides aurantiacus]
MPPTVTPAAPATGLTQLPARELAALVRLGRLSAQDVLAAHLDRLAAVAPELAHTRRAGNQVVRLDTRLRHDLPGGALAGVPVLVRPDLVAAARLTAAGAVVLASRDLSDAAAAAAVAAVTDHVLPLALVAAGPAGSFAPDLVRLDLTVGAERVRVLARDVRDAGLLLGVLGAAYGPGSVLSLPRADHAVPRPEAEARLLAAAARVPRA